MRFIIVEWVPSHMRIPGNEKADIEARKYADILSTDVSVKMQTLAYARKAIRQKRDKAWLQTWKNQERFAGSKILVPRSAKINKC